MIEMVVDEEMTVGHLRADRGARQYMIWLRSVDSDAVLPIVIGSTEAMAIYGELTGERISRPLTHDLLRSILDHFETQVEKVKILDLKEGVFFGELVLLRGGEHLRLDVRPSDGIALALKYGAPIYMSEKVIEEVGRQEEGGLADIADAVNELLEETEPEEEPAARVSKLVRLKRRIGLLNKRMEEARKEERYEEAGRLRDQITRLKETLKGA
ncbi:MAG: DUF151 domain-containing protein [Candidatus Latescibacteria bacterium]|jgi:hypothetical protein|nr:DUF151 domain-containing protein [Candidatus Latescibacterota bacterium]